MVRQMYCYYYVRIYSIPLSFLAKYAGHIGFQYQKPEITFFVLTEITYIYMDAVAFEVEGEKK